MSRRDLCTILSSERLPRSPKVKVISRRLRWELEVKLTSHGGPKRQLVGRQRISRRWQGEGRFLRYSRPHRLWQTILYPQPSSCRNINPNPRKQAPATPRRGGKGPAICLSTICLEPTLWVGHLRQRFQIPPTCRYFQGLRAQFKMPASFQSN